MTVQEEITQFFKNDSHTIGPVYAMVLKITEVKDMKAFFLDYSAWILNHSADPISLKIARKIARSNIGWCFGEGMTQDMMTRWHNATGARHFAFGVTKPTMQEAFDLGVKMGKKWKRQAEREERKRAT